MKSKNLNLAQNQVYKSTPNSIIEILAIQMDRVDESQERINREGIVVRDLKGSVIPHPAIKIEIEAGKIICDLLKKHGA